MYKLDIPLDLKERAAIELRRRAEKERQGRVFNSRYRQTGVRSDELLYLINLFFSYRSIKKHLINKWKIEIG
jgi:hypothetical protein